MDVLLVAAKKEKIADYTGVITQAGRTAAIVDVDAFALQNAYEKNYGLDSHAVVALINFGASAINVNILGGGQSLFTRDISIGGHAYTEALQKELNLSYESAEMLKRGVPVQRPHDGIRAADSTHGQRKRAARNPEDLRFLPQHDPSRIGSIGSFVSGGASRVEGFTEMLAERFDVDVEAFDPFKTISFEPAKFGVDSAADVAATSAVAVGLALRRVGDR